MKPRSGYTLPVFASASAIAALRYLHQEEVGEKVWLNLIEPAQRVEIEIEQVARIGVNQALAITRSDPGDNLDITRHTPVWAIVELKVSPENLQSVSPGEFKETESIGSKILIQGGEGVGKLIDQPGKSAIYQYAQRLLRENLAPLLKPEEQIIVTIILPEGRKLAQRTSNEAFGVVEGLSLLGTSGISQPLSAIGQLDVYLEELKLKARKFDTLVFCVGENGLDLAQQMGINPEQRVKTANWLGPMLVAAGVEKVKGILLFGYHGKLIKLAGGIFHTHHHLADGRLEILTAHLAQLGLATSILQQVFRSKTTEEALIYLRQFDQEHNTHWVEQVYRAIAAQIDERCSDYIRKHTQESVWVGSVLFDRDRSIIVKSENSRLLGNTI
ncbi:cobalamin biosynthesis protein CbiD [Gloeothece citriformis PCC 7424]|uniref:Cobalt-precorrin-5B C(1)-methyltransferase n=2 Tax=Gloeothece TaxID=28070 RepID=B7KI84_GLOC7|nr:cobalamin biosynthesis protein CbiD [Gloeothece citriformis PCC 7424]